MSSAEPETVLDIPLPEDIELLSSGEILSLLKEHSNQLQSYVTRFHPQHELKQEVGQLRGQLQLMEHKFEELEADRSRTQRQLEECRIMEAQYVKKWQDLRQRTMEKNSDEALQKGLEGQIHHWDDLSVQLETGQCDDLDHFLEEYLQARTEYHILHEKLATWNQQGKLRM